MISPDRIRYLNDAPVKGRDFVLYWMQASQRTRYNHALEYAIAKANELKKPLIVYFGLTDKYPEANVRHITFLLEGLREVKAKLKDRGIRFVIQLTSPEVGVIKFSKAACMVITDMGYLQIQRQWRKTVAEKIDCSMVQVESDVVVPIGAVSDKREYAARTIRPKIHKQLEKFLKPVRHLSTKVDSTKMKFDEIDISDITKLLAKIDIDKTVLPTKFYKGGMSQAKKLLKDFIKNKLDRYDVDRNDPSLNGLSNMSGYLHFGQVSPLYIAIEVLKTKSAGSEAYLEELIVRRELSMNFVYYTDGYDKYSCLPGWAKTALEKSKKDKREYVYTLEQFENTQTHDEIWNAAQREMVITGKMHGYMRMYWGKKIIEWTKKPEDAFKYALYLNNKYELDGRDANGYAGVAWCFGNHDRPWAGRKIFGIVRYMNDKGLKRKFDTEAYIQKVNSLAKSI